MIKQQTYIIHEIYFLWFKRRKKAVWNAIAIQAVYTNRFCCFIGSSALVHVGTHILLMFGPKMLCAMSHALRIFVSSKNIRVAKKHREFKCFLSCNPTRENLKKMLVRRIYTNALNLPTALKINDGNEHTLFHLKYGHFSWVSPIFN